MILPGLRPRGGTGPGLSSVESGLPACDLTAERTMDRHHWSRRISQLDPARDYHEIYRILASHELPGDKNPTPSFALYRAYAVTSIGRPLGEPGEFTQRTQKRYDDTALILDTILEHRLDSPLGPSALRRTKHMHGADDISNDDKLYVLAT